MLSSSNGVAHVHSALPIVFTTAPPAESMVMSTNTHEAKKFPLLGTLRTNLSVRWRNKPGLALKKGGRVPSRKTKGNVGRDLEMLALYPFQCNYIASCHLRKSGNRGYYVYIRWTATLFCSRLLLDNNRYDAKSGVHVVRTKGTLSRQLSLKRHQDDFSWAN